MANSSNVTLRLISNGGTGAGLTYDQLDDNFLELIAVIDDFNAHILSTTAHAAEDITFDNAYTGSSYASTNVQDALVEIETEFYNHVDSTTAHPAANITYDNGTSGLTANEVQAALDEIDSDLDTHLGSSTAHAAVDLTYDNASSGLAATDVQSAIDEIDSNVDNLSATDVSYDNSTSGLSATDVQSALDEIDGSVDGKVDTDSEASLLNIAFEEFTTATSGSLDLDASTATSFIIDVSGTIDITLSGTTASKTHEIYVEATNSGGSLSWTTSVEWDGGTAPALGTNYTVYKLAYINGTWYGNEFVSG